MVGKQTAHGDTALSEIERPLHEVWLLGTAQRRGVVLQYFLNHANVEWDIYSVMTCSSLASIPLLADAASSVDAGQLDRYEPVIELENGIDQAYEIV